MEEIIEKFDKCWDDFKNETNNFFRMLELIAYLTYYLKSLEEAVIEKMTGKNE